MAKGLIINPFTGEALVDNSFCPTGAGGGVDPTCGPSGSRSTGGKGPVRVTKGGTTITSPVASLSKSDLDKNPELKSKVRVIKSLEKKMAANPHPKGTNEYRAYEAPLREKHAKAVTQAHEVMKKGAKGEKDEAIKRATGLSTKQLRKQKRTARFDETGYRTPRNFPPVGTIK